ncbi:MAG: hypothetical protein KKD44_19965 [Proteobacteria bacterium]|nr:hypothetical protein [Pseudomonadota bacterium]
MDTRCPGNELNKSLSTFSCDCPSCGKANEIFGDEMNKKHKCTACGTDLDLSKCKKAGKA